MPQKKSIQDDGDDEDNIEEDALIMDVFTVEEGEAMIVKRSVKLKQMLKLYKKHLASSYQVSLSLIK